MCGASNQQTEIEQQQQQFYSTLTEEAGQTFGSDSALFSDITSALEPIFAAGPSQEGFSSKEMTTLNTEATSGVTENYQAAEKAIRENDAAEGGGNEYIPSGQETATEAGVTEAAAGQESTEQQQIELASENQGHADWQAAEEGLLSAPSIMNPATSFANAATSGGTAASSTANQIAQENQSWMGALGGMLGQVGSAVVSENPGNIFG